MCTKSFYIILFLSVVIVAVKGQKSSAKSIKHTLSNENCTKNYSQLPLKPARTITISTDEGSNMDVDISPDGNTIIFTLLGELFTVPATGGNATQLTRGLAINLRPVWSPDGKYIAYISDASGERHLHVRDLTGKYHKILGKSDAPLFKDQYNPVREFEPIWLPESENIVANLNVYHLSGFKRRLPEELIDASGNDFNNRYLNQKYNTIIGFTRKSRYIYFEESPSGRAVKRYHRDSGTVTTIVKNDKNNPQDIINTNSNARISPDGRWLSYFQSKDGCIDSLMLYDIEKGIKKSLVLIQPNIPSRINEQHYSFSSDSKYLYIGYGGKIHRVDIQSGKKDIINFQATVMVDLAPLVQKNFRISHDSLSVKYIRSANANPDGSKLVFSALSKIYIQNMPNGKPVVLVNQSGGQYQPTFSADGKWIAYVNWEDEKGGHVWRVSVFGGKPLQVSTVAGQYQHPAWSADGKFIVVAKGNSKLGGRNNPGYGEIQILSVEDGSMQVISSKVPLFNMPSFSTDGTGIYYTPAQSSANFAPKLVYKSIDEKNGKEYSVANGGRIYPLSFLNFSQQMLVSPDGRYLVYMVNENLHFVPLLQIGMPVMIHDTAYQQPIIRIATGAQDPHWENGGKILSWSYGNKYYRVATEKLITACMKAEEQTAAPESKIIDIAVVPDQVFKINLTQPRHFGHGTIALKNARIVTMANKKVIEKGTVLIKDGRIVFAGANNIDIPTNSKIYDFSGKTIIPGLLDLHVHMGVPPDVLPQIKNNWLASFAYGVTTVRDPSGSVSTFGFAELVETGKTIGPRFFNVGDAVRDFYNITSLEEARVVVNNRARLGAICVKQYMQNTTLQKQWLLKACLEAGVNMTNEGGRLPLEYISMIKMGSSGIEHLPMFGYIYKDVINFLSSSGTFITPTLQAGLFENGRAYFRSKYALPTKKMKLIFDSVDYEISHYSKLPVADTINYICSDFFERCRQMAAVRKAGGKIALGSHSEDIGIGAHFELWALQMGGLTNYEALEIATIESAKALGLQKDLGSIEVGKIADLVILDKNPLENIHNSTSIKYVMKDGVLYDGDMLDTIWPVKKKLRDYRNQ